MIPPPPKDKATDPLPPPPQQPRIPQPGTDRKSDPVNDPLKQQASDTNRTDSDADTDSDSQMQPPPTLRKSTTQTEQPSPTGPEQPPPTGPLGAQGLLRSEADNGLNSYLSTAVGYMAATYPRDFLDKLPCPPEYRSPEGDTSSWERVRDSLNEYIEATRNPTGETGPLPSSYAQSFNDAFFAFLKEFMPYRRQAFYTETKQPGFPGQMPGTEPREKMVPPGKIIKALERNSAPQ